MEKKILLLLPPGLKPKTFWWRVCHSTTELSLFSEHKVKQTYLRHAHTHAHAVHTHTHTHTHTRTYTHTLTYKLSHTNTQTCVCTHTYWRSDEGVLVGMPVNITNTCPVTTIQVFDHLPRQQIIHCKSKVQSTVKVVFWRSHNCTLIKIKPGC